MNPDIRQIREIPENIRKSEINPEVPKNPRKFETKPEYPVNNAQ